MTVRALIVEDEPAGRDALKGLLARHCPEIDVIATADSVASGQAAIVAHRPHLLFLDIELAGGSGFTLLEGLPHRDFAVIFTTAHDHYAIRAIKSAAIDYLLKPIDPDELVLAVAKLDRAALTDSSAADARITRLLAAMASGGPAGKRRLALPTSEGVLVVSASEVIRCEARGNCTEFHLTRGRQVQVSRTLKVYEDLLSDERFFRIHIQHLINLDHLQQYLRVDGGSVRMSDSEVLPISRRRREEFLATLDSATLGLRVDD